MAYSLRTAPFGRITLWPVAMKEASCLKSVQSSLVWFLTAFLPVMFSNSHQGNHVYNQIYTVRAVKNTSIQTYYLHPAPTVLIFFGEHHNINMKQVPCKKSVIHDRCGKRVNREEEDGWFPLFEKD